ncbi:MAG: hypothetical protein LBP93_09695 [Treponema sp.]|jgi:hypothetical protein|nr:hypothetical protein [Treponema sp.]
MKNNSCGGFASAQFLFALFFLSSLSMGTAFFLSSVIKTEGSFRRTGAATAEIDAILEAILADLSADPSPEINGPDDPVLNWNGETGKGYTISVRPLSDRLNPNFIRKNIFEKTKLMELLNPGTTPDGLQQFREDHGLSLVSQDYEDFFSPGVFQKYLSPYGWANINLIDEFALRQLVRSLTGSEHLAEEIRNKVQILLINQERVSGETLRSFLGIDYGSLFPFINAEPLMNVNHTEPLLLKEIIAYPDYRITGAEIKYQDLAARLSREALDIHQVMEILDIDRTHPVLNYLGSITWFWEIIITGNKLSCRTVVCRLPPEDPSLSEPAQFRIIEQRYE